MTNPSSTRHRCYAIIPRSWPRTSILPPTKVWIPRLEVPQTQPPPSGRRQAFDDVLRPLTPEDLSSPGTQTIILHMLQEARAKADALSGYVERFNDADKRAGILQEQLTHEKKTSNATEVAATSCTTIGGVIFGVALYFFGKTQPDVTAGVVAFVIGGVMIGIGLTIKLLKR